MRTLDELIESVVNDAYEAESEFNAIKSSLKKQEYLKYYKRMKRRSISDGFPISEPLTKPEADEYVLQKKPHCLLCGWEGKGLAWHIAKSHNITAEEYKLAYRLPFKSHLLAESTLKLLSDRAKTDENFIAGRDRAMNTDGYREMLYAKMRAKYKERAGATTYHGQQAAKNGEKAPRKERMYTQADFDRIIELMTANDMLYSDVRDRFDEVPGDFVFYGYLMNMGNNRKIYTETVESLSFKTQARGNLLGKRFRRAAIKAVKEHGGWRQAARVLGVSEMAVAKHLKNRIKRENV